jgi:hypothetical protein
LIRFLSFRPDVFARHPATGAAFGSLLAGARALGRLLSRARSRVRVRGACFGQSIGRLFVTAATGRRSQLAQGIHLGRSQRTTSPFGQTAQTERSERDATQAHDLMSDPGK